MQNKTERSVRQYHRARRQRVRACAALTVLALVVSMGTGLALIKPAATMENTTYCGLEAHIHNEECFEPALICTDEDREGHTHEDACWAYPCGLEETEGHTHHDECYSLGCGMTEAHVHTDCVDCTLAEAHTHGEGCYETAEVLICEQDGVEGHEHVAECYAQQQNVICGKEEIPEHIHSEACKVLVCGQEEREAHSHELCGEQVLVCGREESEPYDTDHVHDPELCYEDKLICEKEEHEHVDACYIAPVVYCGLEEHFHSEFCVDENGLLVCGMENHVHVEECFVEPREVFCGYEEHVHEAACLDEFGNLICGLEEHVHEDACYVESQLMILLPEGAEVPEGYTEEYSFMGERFAVAVFAPEGALPEGAVLVAELLEEDSDAYAEAEQAVSETTEFDGMVAMDVRFELNEKEIEPSVPVYVCINAVGLLPENADPESVVVQHIKECVKEFFDFFSDEEEVSVEVVANAEEETGVVEAAPNETVASVDVNAAFDLESFSILTVSYNTKKTVDASTVGELLNGDFAYVYDVRIKDKGFTTGTEPFDTTAGAGNDTTANDSILRTFDSASYTVEYHTGLRQEVKDRDISGYKTGRLYFEIILPTTADKAIFNTEEMLWLKAAKEIVYENVTVDGKQILRGSFMLTPNNENPAAIGASVNELTISVRALAMHNNDTLQPSVTLWLEHNDVGTTYENNIPKTVVTGTNYACTKQDTDSGKTVHGKEFVTLQLNEIKISARPMYNVELARTSSSQNTVVGTYDFDTGNTTAINYGAGKKYGRLSAIGIAVEMRGKTGQGMRGMELPDTTKEITFTVDLSSYYKPSTGVTKPDIDKNYPVMYYSGDANQYTRTSSGDGRIVDAYQAVAMMVPCASGDAFDQCEDGGQWIFEADSSNPAKLKITVKDFSFDSYKFPYTYADGTQNTYSYYNPKNITNWWESDRAVFSAGELWIFQPYYLGEVNQQEYIVQKYGCEGDFHTQVEVSDFRAVSAAGTVTTTQVVAKADKNDDLLKFSNHLKNPGSVDGYIAYLNSPSRSWDDALTDGALNTDNDWAVQGQQIEIRSHTMYSDAENEFAAVAIRQLIKFDDEFFDPISVKQTNTAYFTSDSTRRLFWAVKPDKTGWANDEDMKKATPDDLLFYEIQTSANSFDGAKELETLKADGYAVVGILDERYGLQTVGSHNIMVFIRGKVKTDCRTNEVYMTTRNSYVWREIDVDDAAAAKLGKAKSALTDADYLQYMKNYFPTYQHMVKGDLMNDNTGAFKGVAPFWRHDWWRTDHTSKINLDGTIVSSDSEGCKNAAKATYDASGWHGGNGQKNYQDSCLVMPYKTTISKAVAQQSGDGNPKEAYDMNQNQRVVDFVLYPKIERSLGTGASQGAILSTVVTVTDILPAGLTYIDGSARLGGTYAQDPQYQNAGAVTGGLVEQTSIASGDSNYFQRESITKNADGTTTIVWKFPITVGSTQAVWSDPIYYSCTIGDVLNEENDVQNQAELINQAMIISDKEKLRDYTVSNGNLAVESIKITKTGAMSLSKLADQLYVDGGKGMGFTMNIGNNSSTERSGLLIVESLPVNGQNGSSFHGALKVTEFSAGVFNDYTASQSLLKNFTFYYTTAAKYAGCTSASLKTDGVNVATSSEWTKLTVSAKNTTTGRPGAVFETVDEKAFPSGISQTSQITAIAAVGTLPANKTLKMHITFDLPKGQAGDVVVNTLSQDTLVSSAKCAVINRVIEGLTWMDTNADGIQDSGEAQLAGVKVSLMKLNTATSQYELVETIQSGQVYDLTSAATSDYGEGTTNDGRYKFINLSDGTYGLKFTAGSGNADLSKYMASPDNISSDTQDTVDSDGVPTYTKAADGTVKLQETWIKGIVLKPASEIKVEKMDSSANNDSGFCTTTMTVKKVVERTDTLTDKSGTFTFTAQLTGEDDVTKNVKYTVQKNGGSDELLAFDGDGKATFTLQHNEQIVFKNLPVDVTVTVTEADCPGYSTGWTVNDGDKILVMQAQATPVGNPILVCTNTTGAELPSTGGMGTTIFYIIGAVLMVGAVVVLVAKKKMGREE